MDRDNESGLKAWVRKLPFDIRIAGPIALIVMFTFVGFAFLLTSNGDTTAAVVPPSAALDDPEPTTSASASATPQPTPPSGECSQVAEDTEGDWLAFPRRNPERMYAKEGYKFNYNLYWPDHVTAHGIAIERPGASGGCFEERFFCAWDGQSAQDGYPEAGFPPNSYADSRTHFGIAGFTMPEKPQEPGENDWPIESFRYVAYARTADGTYQVTPLQGATVGDGIVEVRYHNKGNNAGEVIALCDPGAEGYL